MLILCSFFYSVLPASVIADGVSIISCHGNDHDTSGLMYFHGLDPKKPSIHERFNRKELALLSKRKKMKLVILRSNYLCKNERNCWPMESASTLKRVYSEAMQASANCLKNTQNITAIGFSNGGYFLSKLVQWCLPNTFDRIIAVGSAGSFRKHEKKLLSTCGLLELFVGKKDITYKKARVYEQELRKRKADVIFKAFEGRHELPRLDIIFP